MRVAFVVQQRRTLAVKQGRDVAKAVLCHTHAHLDHITRRLTALGIPYVRSVTGTANPTTRSRSVPSTVPKASTSPPSTSPTSPHRGTHRPRPPPPAATGTCCMPNASTSPAPVPVTGSGSAGSGRDTSTPHPPRTREPDLHPPAGSRLVSRPVTETRAAPMIACGGSTLISPSRWSEPMHWLIDEPGRLRMECTGFGLNFVSGNYEFACLIVIEDEEFWPRYVGGGRIELGVIALRRHSAQDRSWRTRDPPISPSQRRPSTFPTRSKAQLPRALWPPLREPAARAIERHASAGRADATHPASTCAPACWLVQ